MGCILSDRIEFQVEKGTCQKDALLLNALSPHFIHFKKRD